MQLAKLESGQKIVVDFPILNGKRHGNRDWLQVLLSSGLSSLERQDSNPSSYRPESFQYNDLQRPFLESLSDFLLFVLRL